jgi:hypothetical protein
MEWKISVMRIGRLNGEAARGVPTLLRRGPYGMFARPIPRMEAVFPMSRKTRLLLLAPLVAALFLSGCGKEKTESSNEPASFTFTIYPGSRYLAQLTEMTKQAHKTLKPNEEPPPVAIYDTDAPVERVAEFYATAYGYNTVAPDATNNLSTAKPPAYYRSGELATDAKGMEPVLQKMSVQADISKAQGHYRAAEIEPKLNRPRVTVQRPYFDATTSQTVDRTLILMAR